VLHAQTKVLDEDIYIVAFFLHPAYCCVAVSKKHAILNIGQMILWLAKKWKFTKTEAGFLQDAVSRYYSGVYPFHSKNVNRPLDFWLSVQKTPKSNPLKNLAIALLEIVPHTAGVKVFFSMMNAIKTKSCN
jgi:hypothetical protein